jgi:hypothetical protein
MTTSGLRHGGPVWLVVCTLSCVDALAGEPAQPASARPQAATMVPGFEKEPLRLLFCEDVPIAQAEFQRIRDAGFNLVSLIHWKVYERSYGRVTQANIANARQAGLKVLLTLWPGTSLAPPDFAAAHPFEFHNGARPRDARADQTCGPDRITLPVDIYDAEYWDTHLIPICLEYARLSREGTVRGCALDMELYLRDPVPTVYEDVCFCDRCLTAFAADRKGDVPTTKPVAERLGALADGGRLEEYRAWQNDRLAAYIRRLRARTDEQDPEFVYALLPYTRKGNFFSRALAKGLATDRAPVLLMTEGTYNPVPQADDAQDLAATAGYLADLRQREILYGDRSVLLPGFSVVTLTADRMARRVSAFGRVQPGYWVWGRNWIRRAEAAKPAELWEAFTIGNRAATGAAGEPVGQGPWCLPTVEAGDNLVPQGSFEGADVKGAWQFTRGGQVLGDAARHGGMGLRLTAMKNSRRPTAIPLGPDRAAALPVEAGRAYRLSFWSRTIRFVGGYNAYAEVHWLDERGQDIGRIEVGTGTNVHDWVLCSGVVVAPKQARSLRLEIAALGSGITSDVDDVALQLLAIRTDRQDQAH